VGWNRILFRERRYMSAHTFELMAFLYALEEFSERYQDGVLETMEMRRTDFESGLRARKLLARPVPPGRSGQGSRHLH